MVMNKPARKAEERVEPLEDRIDLRTPQAWEAVPLGTGRNNGAAVHDEDPDGLRVADASEADPRGALLQELRTHRATDRGDDAGCHDTELRENVT
jgi:hypothetical protein